MSATGLLSDPLRTYKALETLNPPSPHCEVSHQFSTICPVLGSACHYTCKGLRHKVLAQAGKEGQVTGTSGARVCPHGPCCSQAWL